MNFILKEKVDIFSALLNDKKNIKNYLNIDDEKCSLLKYNLQSLSFFFRRQYDEVWELRGKVSHNAHRISSIKLLSGSFLSYYGIRFRSWNKLTENLLFLQIFKSSSIVIIFNCQFRLEFVESSVMKNRKIFNLWSWKNVNK